MLAEKNPYIASAAQTIYRVSEDDYIRNLCEGREEGEKTQRTIELLHQMEREKSRKELEKANLELEQTTHKLQQKDHELQQAKDELQQLRQKEAQLAAALARIAELEAGQK